MMSAPQDNLMQAVVIMMAGNLGREFPDLPSSSVQIAMKNVTLAAEGVVRKLVEKWNIEGAPLTSKQWRCFVDRATQDAFMEFWDGTLVRLGDDPTFVKAVEDITGLVVAPVGSQWRKAVIRKQEKIHRRYLQRTGISSSEIDRVLHRWRALNEAGEVVF